MIEQIMSSLKGEMMQKFADKQGVPAGKMDDAAVLAKDNVIGTVREEVQQGNLNGLMDLLNSKEQLNSNPIVTNMIKRYAGDLGTKLGFEPQMASSVAGFAIPFVLNKFIGQASSQGFNPAMLMGMLGGGGQTSGSNDLGDLLNGKMGDSLGGLFK